MLFRRLSAFVLIALFAIGLVPVVAQDAPTFPVTIEHQYGSTTITEAPKRVVAIGFTEQDLLLSVGVTPIAARYWYGDETNVIFPWAVDKVEGDAPIVLNMPFGALNLEAILSLDPDLISAVTSGVTEDEYKLLSEIAPTIVQSGDYINFGMPWQAATLLVGESVGKLPEAEAAVADVEAKFEEVRTEHPEYAEKSIVVAYYSEGTFGFYTDQDARGRFFTELGFNIPQELVEIAGEAFYANISNERFDLLNQDVIAIVNLQFVTGGRETIEADPLFSQLDAVKEGRVVYLDVNSENALGFSSPLSLPYALDAVLPQLEAMFPAAETAAVTCEAGLRAFAGVCIPENPQRVVTITDSDLDAVLALGVDPIGITNGRGQSTPPRYLSASIPETATVVGDFFTPNLEAVLELAPDLILAAGLADPATLEQLNAIAPTVDTYVNGYDWKTHFQTVGDALNKSAEAEAFLTGYTDRIAELQTTLADNLDDQFIVARWSADGPQVMAPITFVSAVLFELGLSSPEEIPELEGGHAHSAPLSLETLGVIDTDWAFLGTLQSEGDAVDAFEAVKENPLFQALEVAKNNHVVFVDGSLWTSSGGPLAVMLVLDNVEAAFTGAQ